MQGEKCKLLLEGLRAPRVRILKDVLSSCLSLTAYAETSLGMPKKEPHLGYFREDFLNSEVSKYLQV